MKKVGILSLGCPRNLVDSESILGRINAKGYPVVDMNKADIGIINTCAFIEDAKKESIDAILDLLELKKEGRLERVIVYGCLSQRYKEQLSREFPEVDAFVGRVSLNHETRRYPLTPAHFAYLKICESCVNNCSFCIIPKIKGRFQSLDMDSVLRKVEGFNKQGVSELNIIGQDITGFGMDLYKRPRLSWLLREILKKATDIDWIRLLYLYPNRISEELLELISSEKKFCKYIDLPIQHINQRILSLMNRDTTKEETIKLIAKIRKIIPGVVLRTSIIAGFPSETEKEFKELLRFLKEVRFERLGAFIYSREENTPAYGFQGQIPEKIKIERFDAIMSLQREVSSEVNSRMIGQIIDVLIDEEENGSYLGRSQYDAPEVDGLVYVRSKQKLKAGDFVKVKINDTLEYDLIGEVVKR
ncbi:MAG: MiaB/RimO family radical SAM methylthiotransferase [Candidatus Omnitrophica bacterium]|nr:MiaB/RimO family radical SAM methylthiotransferase [Candidatus Omnitrophota bacterium]MBU1090244.1 MiaB/RimO family radical SAM methylthiotransferase [Candidatus Omnitrophota bacterium]